MALALRMLHRLLVLAGCAAGDDRHGRDEAHYVVQDAPARTVPATATATATAPVGTTNRTGEGARACAYEAFADALWALRAADARRSRGADALLVR